VILRSGGFCAIREKSVDHRDWLLLVVDYWDSEADFKAGKPPILQSDHDWGPGHEKIADLLPQLLVPIEGEHTSGRRGDHRDHTRKRGASDPHGFLAHPHVQALEVTP